MEEEAQKLSEMNAEVEKQVDSVQNEYGKFLLDQSLSYLTLGQIVELI